MPAGANITSDSSDYYFTGYTIQYECPPGKRFASGQTRELAYCSEDAKWLTIEPFSDCVDIYCPNLPVVHNAVQPPSVVENATFGSSVTFECEASYDLIGASVLQCQDNGEWSSGLPVCTLLSGVNNCSEPLAPQFGTLESQTDDCCADGAEVSVRCVAGYQLSNAGSNTMKCSNGTWTPTMECSRICCPEIAIPVDSENTSIKIEFQTGGCFADSVVFACPTGYAVVGAKQVNCTANGSWSEAVVPLPSCAVVHCDVPQMNGTLHVSLTESSFGSVMNYSCDVGYSLIGDSSCQCQADGTWSGITPQCKPNECDVDDLKSLVPYLQVNANQSVFYFGETLTVSCGQDEAFLVQCGANGWLTDSLITSCINNSPRKSRDFSIFLKFDCQVSNSPFISSALRNEPDFAELPERIRNTSLCGNQVCEQRWCSQRKSRLLCQSREFAKRRFSEILQ